MYARKVGASSNSDVISTPPEIVHGSSILFYSDKRYSVAGPIGVSYQRLAVKCSIVTGSVCALMIIITMYRTFSYLALAATVSLSLSCRGISELVCFNFTYFFNLTHLPELSIRYTP